MCFLDNKNKKTIKELKKQGVTITKLESALGLMIDYAIANLNFCKEITDDIAKNEPKIGGYENTSKPNIKKLLDKEKFINDNKKHLDYINQPGIYYKRYIAVTHLHEAINILSTLLLSSPEEVSFDTYFIFNKKHNKELKSRINKIADEFGKKKFKEYRNKNIAHKSFLWINKDPFTLLISTVKKETLDYLLDVLPKIRAICHEKFENYIISNPYFYDNSKKGLSEWLNQKT